MSDLRKAAEMALEFIVLSSSKDRAWFTEKEFEVVATLRQALAHPEWVSLTEDEFEAILESHNEAFQFAVYQSIETKLKEKNT